MTTKIGPAVDQRLATVREAFRNQRRAQQRRRLWKFYREHELFAEAEDARRSMMKYLRLACRQWRSALGGPSPSVNGSR